MTQFFPDLVLPHDDAGLSFWLIGHYFEHQAMANAALALSTPFTVPPYDLRVFPPDLPNQQKDWFNVHELIHEAHRSISGIQGFDLAASNWQDDDAFFSWMQDHALEHMQLRQFYGLP